MRSKLFTLLLTCALSTTLFARPHFYFNTAISKPFAPESFSGDWHSGYELGVGAGFMMNKRLEIIPAFDYNNFALNDQSFLSDYLGQDNIYSSVTGGTTHLFHVGIDAKYLVPPKVSSKITPYIIGGAGFGSRIITEKEIITAAETSHDPRHTFSGAWAGGGLGFEFIMGGNTYFVLEGRFNVLFADKATIYAPIKFGITIK
ncbi:hypothetical protein DRI50_09145 [candidate division KSB1 bacterium]|nr:MAG: hypothetical protein DRI50_09145 [candidate division KSB1 bacterium]